MTRQSEIRGQLFDHTLHAKRYTGEGVAENHAESRYRILRLISGVDSDNEQQAHRRDQPRTGRISINFQKLWLLLSRFPGPAGMPVGLSTSNSNADGPRRSSWS